LSSADILRTAGFFTCGRLHFLEQKTSDFLKFMVCQHGQGGREGLSQCRQGGKGSILCGHLLWMTPNYKTLQRGNIGQNGYHCYPFPILTAFCIKSYSAICFFFCRIKHARIAIAVVKKVQ